MVNIVILRYSLGFDSKPPSDSKICRCPSLLFLSTLVVPNHFGTKDPFCGRQFFHGPSRRDDLEMIQVHLFTVHFISIIITSAPPQIIGH